MVEQFEDFEEDNHFDGTIKESGSDSFEKVVIQGDLFLERLTWSLSVPERCASW